MGVVRIDLQSEDHASPVMSYASGMLKEERPVDVYVGLSKTFSAVSHNILIDKVMKYRPDKWTVEWTES